jgi:hypothetical protein
MNCDDMGRLLIGEPLPIEAAKHLQKCEQCRVLVHALNAPVHADIPSPETIHRIEQQLSANLQPVRPLPSPGYFVLSFVLLFLGAVSMITSVWGATAIPVMNSSQIVPILVVLAISAGVLAMSLAHLMLPGSKHRFSPQRLPAVVVVATGAAIALLFQFQEEHEFLKAGAIAGSIASLPLWLVLRRSAILSPALTGATTGLLAGLVGTAALDMHCPILNAWHLLAGHLGPAVICCLAGLIVGLVAEGRFSRFEKVNLLQ